MWRRGQDRAWIKTDEGLNRKRFEVDGKQIISALAKGNDNSKVGKSSAPLNFGGSVAPIQGCFRGTRQFDAITGPDSSSAVGEQSSDTFSGTNSGGDESGRKDVGTLAQLVVRKLLTFVRYCDRIAEPFSEHAQRRRPRNAGVQPMRSFGNHSEIEGI